MSKDFFHNIFGFIFINNMKNVNTEMYANFFLQLILLYFVIFIGERYDSDAVQQMVEEHWGRLYKTGINMIFYKIKVWFFRMHLNSMLILKVNSIISMLCMFLIWTNNSETYFNKNIVVLVILFKDKSKDSKAHPLSVQNIGGVFVVLLCGLALAIMVRRFF